MSEVNLNKDTFFEELENYYKIEEGDILVINRKPAMWNSILSNLSPLKCIEVKEYPYTLEVVTVKGDCFLCNAGYSWSSYYVVEAGCKRLK